MSPHYYGPEFIENPTVRQTAGYKIRTDVYANLDPVIRVLVSKVVPAPKDTLNQEHLFTGEGKEKYPAAAIVADFLYWGFDCSKAHEMARKKFLDEGVEETVPPAGTFTDRWVRQWEWALFILRMHLPKQDLKRQLEYPFDCPGIPVYPTHDETYQFHQEVDAQYPFDRAYHRNPGSTHRHRERIQCIRQTILRRLQQFWQMTPGELPLIRRIHDGMSIEEDPPAPKYLRKWGIHMARKEFLPDWEETREDSQGGKTQIISQEQKEGEMETGEGPSTAGGEIIFGKPWRPTPEQAAEMVHWEGKGIGRGGSLTQAGAPLPSAPLIAAQSVDLERPPTPVTPPPAPPHLVSTEPLVYSPSSVKDKRVLDLVRQDERKVRVYRTLVISKPRERVIVAMQDKYRRFWEFSHKLENYANKLSSESIDPVTLIWRIGKWIQEQDVGQMSISAKYTLMWRGLLSLLSHAGKEEVVYGSESRYWANVVERFLHQYDVERSYQRGPTTRIDEKVIKLYRIRANWIMDMSLQRNEDPQAFTTPIPDQGNQPLVRDLSPESAIRAVCIESHPRMSGHGAPPRRESTSGTRQKEKERRQESPRRIVIPPPPRETSRSTSKGKPESGARPKEQRPSVIHEERLERPIFKSPKKPSAKPKVPPADSGRSGSRSRRGKYQEEAQKPSTSAAPIGETPQKPKKQRSRKRKPASTSVHVKHILSPKRGLPDEDFYLGLTGDRENWIPGFLPTHHTVRRLDYREVELWGERHICDRLHEEQPTEARRESSASRERRPVKLGRTVEEVGRMLEEREESERAPVPRKGVPDTTAHKSYYVMENNAAKRRVAAKMFHWVDIDYYRYGFREDLPPENHARNCTFRSILDVSRDTTLRGEVLYNAEPLQIKRTAENPKGTRSATTYPVGPRDKVARIAQPESWETVDPPGVGKLTESILFTHFLYHPYGTPRAEYVYTAREMNVVNARVRTMAPLRGSPHRVPTFVSLDLEGIRIEVDHDRQNIAPRDPDVYMMPPDFDFNNPSWGMQTREQYTESLKQSRLKYLDGESILNASERQWKNYPILPPNYTCDEYARCLQLHFHDNVQIVLDLVGLCTNKVDVDQLLLEMKDDGTAGEGIPFNNPTTGEPNSGIINPKCIAQFYRGLDDLLLSKQLREDGKLPLVFVVANVPADRKKLLATLDINMTRAPVEEVWAAQNRGERVIPVIEFDDLMVASGYHLDLTKLPEGGPLTSKGREKKMPWKKNFNPAKVLAFKLYGHAFFERVPIQYERQRGPFTEKRKKPAYAKEPRIVRFTRGCPQMEPHLDERVPTAQWIMGHKGNLSDALNIPDLTQAPYSVLVYVEDDAMTTTSAAAAAAIQREQTAGKVKGEYKISDDVLQNIHLFCNTIREFCSTPIEAMVPTQQFTPTQNAVLDRFRSTSKLFKTIAAGAFDRFVLGATLRSGRAREPWSIPPGLWTDRLPLIVNMVEYFCTMPTHPAEEIAARKAALTLISTWWVQTMAEKWRTYVKNAVCRGKGYPAMIKISNRADVTPLMNPPVRDWFPWCNETSASLTLRGPSTRPMIHTLAKIEQAEKRNEPIRLESLTECTISQGGSMHPFVKRHVDQLELDTAEERRRLLVERGEDDAGEQLGPGGLFLLQAQRSSSIQRVLGPADVGTAMDTTALECPMLGDDMLFYLTCQTPKSDVNTRLTDAENYLAPMIYAESLDVEQLKMEPMGYLKGFSWGDKQDADYMWTLIEAKVLRYDQLLLPLHYYVDVHKECKNLVDDIILPRIIDAAEQMAAPEMRMTPEQRAFTTKLMASEIRAGRVSLRQMYFHVFKEWSEAGQALAFGSYKCDYRNDVPYPFPMLIVGPTVSPIMEHWARPPNAIKGTIGNYWLETTKNYSELLKLEMEKTRQIQQLGAQPAAASTTETPTPPAHQRMASHGP